MKGCGGWVRNEAGEVSRGQSTGASILQVMDPRGLATEKYKTELVLEES